MLHNSLLGNQDAEVNSPAADVYTVLVSAHGLVRMGLAQLLEGTNFHISMAVPDVGSAIIPANVSRSLVVLHAASGCTETPSSVRCVRNRFPDAKIVVLADRPDLPLCMAVHAAGGNGVIGTDGDRAVLVKMLDLVALGETVVPAKVMLELLHGAYHPAATASLEATHTDELDVASLKGRNLSAREREILGLIKEGSPNKLIARQLDVTEATVKVHVKAILRKIGASNRTQAAMWAAGHMKAEQGASIAAA